MVYAFVGLDPPEILVFGDLGCVFLVFLVDLDFCWWVFICGWGLGFDCLATAFVLWFCCFASLACYCIWIWFLGFQGFLLFGFSGFGLLCSCFLLLGLLILILLNLDWC